ncbi:MAG: UDP-N-acetylglucosamine 2-epimerase (non-hydrolyzing) [Candidatus Bathyarchaeota archaeon]|nr:UDP-N-acetylglucosamine 2-epimerase (non-hydrolyzing) [Candidatus Bathyarchaeota archaeon]
MRSSLKVVTVLGTRPEIIRLSRVMALLDQHLDHVIVHTGQNYDYELNEIFFKELGIRQPDHYLEVNTETLGTVLGETIIKAEKVFEEEKPDAVLILGDTNSSIACIIAKRMKIPIYHMEAGNRCFDQNVPEEINRRFIDHTADYNLVYTEHARRHLLMEGIHHRRIYLTGSPMKEILLHYEEKISQSKILEKLNLKPKKYFLVSTHREENVDNSTNLKKILSILNSLAEKYSYPVIISTHPRTAKRMESLTEYKKNDNVRFLKPFGYPDYVHLQQNALCTISDSGTISEESAILGFPAINLREATERPEALDAGTIILTGLDELTVLNAIEVTLTDSERSKKIPSEYQVENVSWRVLKLILGTAKLSNKWSGIKKTNMNQ